MEDGVGAGKGKARKVKNNFAVSDFFSFPPMWSWDSKPMTLVMAGLGKLKELPLPNSARSDAKGHSGEPCSLH